MLHMLQSKSSILLRLPAGRAIEKAARWYYSELRLSYTVTVTVVATRVTVTVHVISLHDCCDSGNCNVLECAP